MKYVLYNGFGFLLNVAGFFVLVSGANTDNHVTSVFGIILFLYGILLHTHWWKPACHFYAAICYVIGFYGMFNWGDPDRMAGFYFFVSAMLIHWKFWLIFIFAFWLGEKLAGWIKS